MKKILLLLCALLTGVGGAWATITVSQTALTDVNNISTDKYYILYNQGRKQYLNVSPSTGQILLTSTLPTSDEALLPFVVRFVPNTSAKPDGDAFQLKFYDGTYMQWQSSGSANYVSPTMGFNGSSNEAFLPVYNDTYFYFQVYKGGTSRAQYFNGNSGSFTFWSSYAGNGEYQIYEVTSNDFVEIEYYYSIGTSTSSNAPRKLLAVKSSTVAIPTPTACTSLPAYTSIASAPTASSDGSAISFTLTESYPFLTTALANGAIPASAPLYRLKGNAGATPQYIERTNENTIVYKSGDDVDNDDYFCFTGDAISGFRIYNVGAGTSLNLGKDVQPATNDVPMLTSTDHIWRLYVNGSNFGLQQLTAGASSFSNAYLCNTANTGFSYWASSAAESNNDTGAQMQCERVTFDVTDEHWVRLNDGEYELLSSSTVTYNSGDAYTQNVLTQSASGVALTNDDVIGAPSYVSAPSTVVYHYTTATALSLPFTTTTVSEGEFVSPTWYYMTVNGLPAYANNGKMVVDGSNGSLYYDRWCFVGDAASGVQIYSEATGATKPVSISSMANNDNVVISTVTANSIWYVGGSGLSNITFYQKSGESTFALNQLGGASQGSGWYWRVGLWSTGSTIALTEATDVAAAPKVNNAIQAITNNAAYINVGKTGYPTSTDYNTLNTTLVSAGNNPTADNYKVLREAWNYYYYTAPKIYPASGKFYRIKGRDSRRYLTCEAASNNANRLGASTTADANTIFYLDNKKLLGYKNGYYTASTCEPGSLQTTAEEYTIEAPSEPGLFTIKGGGYLYSWTDNNHMYFDRNGNNLVSECYMYIEEVTELPITFKGQYASFYSPVDLGIPENEGVTVYTGTLEGTKLTLNPVNYVPANTGVILKLDAFSSETSKDFPILSTVTPIENTSLIGTIAAKTVEADSKLVLGKNTDSKWGIYKFTGTTMPGFKAYMDMPANPVKGFAFNFDLPTIVDALNAQEASKGAIYNLAGQRVNKAQKGIYIVNGKKVAVK